MHVRGHKALSLLLSIGGAIALGTLLPILSQSFPSWIIVSMPIMAFIVVLLATLFRSFDVFAPIPLFGGVYTLYYAIGSLPNSSLGWFSKPISPGVLYYGALGLFCFLSGALAAHMILGSGFLKSGRSMHKYLGASIENLSAGQVSRTSLIYAAIGILFALGIFYVAGGIPFLTSDQSANLLRYDAIRKVGYYVHFQLYFLYIGTILTTLASFKHRSLRLFAIIWGGLTCCLFVFTYNRVEIVRILLSLAFIYHYAFRPIKMREVIVLLVLLITSVGLLHMLRVGAVNSSFGVNVRQVFWYFQGSIGFPVRVFELILEAIPSKVGFFRGRFNFSTYASLFGQYPSGPELVREHLFPDRYTAQTVVLPGGWYADGGLWAVVLGMMISGFFLQATYAVFTQRRNVVWLLIYINVAFEMLYSIYLGGGALGVRVWLLILLAVAAYQFSTKKRPRSSVIAWAIVCLVVAVGLVKMVSLLTPA